VRRKERKRRKSNRFPASLQRTWQGWWAEILVALLVPLAIFLLVERMSIRQTLFAWLMGLLRWLDSLIDGLVQGVASFVRNTTLSDLTAYVLLVMAIGLVAWRTRQRLISQPRFAELKCPRCGSGLHRVHRYWPDRVLSIYVPVRRYRCKNHDCGWHGLRVRISRHE